MENVCFIALSLLLQTLNPVVKDHDKLVALMLSPLLSSAVCDVINEGNSSMKWIYGIIDSSRISLLILCVPWCLSYISVYSVMLDR